MPHLMFIPYTLYTTFLRLSNRSSNDHVQRPPELERVSLRLKKERLVHLVQPSPQC